MTQYRDSCGLGPFIRIYRQARPGVSSVKLYAVFLSDKDCALLRKRAMDLYTMRLGWHTLMNIEL